jgi:small nuclear ribonucleoprotein (snRNP)-like protein
MGRVFVNGRLVDYDAAVNLMDAELCEEIHARGIEDEQEYVDAYAAAHLQRFGEEFVVA